ncbi:MAG: hypothetical protein R2698_06725 [Microthrixaceae bacterium]
MAIGHEDALCRECGRCARGDRGRGTRRPRGRHGGGGWRRGIESTRSDLRRAARAAILAACSDKATVRRRAVLALAALDGDDVDAMLGVLLEDRDWQVRQAAEDLTAGFADDVTSGHP